MGRHSICFDTNSGLRSIESKPLPIQHTFYFTGNFIFGRNHAIAFFLRCVSSDLRFFPPIEREIY